MIFEILSEVHAKSLFDFEVENRAWFESLISPRDPEFYSLEGVDAHIQASIDSFQRRESVAMVLLSEREIVARANLKNICLEKQLAEVGYRVAEHCTGKGVASTCLAELIRVSCLNPDIERLQGKVLDNNPASKRVLEKQGFKQLEYFPDQHCINGTAFGCATFERLLNTAATQGN